MNKQKESDEELKQCNVCGKIKPLSEFYRYGSGRKGWRPDCKECRRRYQREHNKRPEVRERMQAYWQEYGERPESKKKLDNYYREYNQRPDIKKRKSEYAKEWATRNKILAYRFTTKQIKRGDIKPASALICVECGRQAKMYFYENYEIPPDRIPLCVSCHRKRVANKLMEEG